MNIAVPSSCNVCTMAPPSPDAALWGCQLCLDQNNRTTTMNKIWKDWWTSSQSCTQMRLAKLRMSTSKWTDFTPLVWTVNSLFGTSAENVELNCWVWNKNKTMPLFGKCRSTTASTTFTATSQDLHDWDEDCGSKSLEAKAVPIQLGPS